MQVKSDVVFRVLGDSAVIVDLSSNRVFELNPTGVAIWEALVRGDAPDAIARELVVAFDIDEPTALSDTVDLIDRLRSAGLIDP